MLPVLIFLAIQTRKKAIRWIRALILLWAPARNDRSLVRKHQLGVEMIQPKHWPVTLLALLSLSPSLCGYAAVTQSLQVLIISPTLSRHGGRRTVSVNNEY